MVWREDPVAAADGRGATGVWTGTELRRLLAEKAGLEMSAASVSALLTKEPSQVKLTTLIALCTALDCTPNDLLEVDTTGRAAGHAVSAGAGRDEEDREHAGTVDAADVAGKPESGCSPMGKRQRDCAACGAPVGIIGRELCCRCVRRQREGDAKQSCPDCGRDRVLVAATSRCVLCSRRCVECAHPVRRAESTLCKTCRRRADLLARQHDCPRCGKAGYLRAETGWCGSCSRTGPPKDPPRICQVCGELRRHEGRGMCSRCWQRHPQRPLVQGEHLAARLEDSPAWLDEFVAHVAEVYSPGRACNVLTALGRLLIDKQPNYPQALLDRARRPGRSLGPLARSLEAFFTEGLAMPTDHAEQLAAGRRKRRIDAVLAPLRPGGLVRRIVVDRPSAGPQGRDVAAERSNHRRRVGDRA